MSFRWDPRKAKANWVKHGVRFSDCAPVFEDERAVTIRDEFAEDERWVTLGVDAEGNVLVVVYAWEGDAIRIISARKASPREREQYEAHHEA